MVPQFLGAEKTGEVMWVNNLPKVATHTTEPHSLMLVAQMDIDNLLWKIMDLL